MYRSMKISYKIEKFKKLKTPAPRKKHGCCEKEKKRWVLAGWRGVGAICRHFFIQDILPPLNACRGSGVLRTMAARNTDVKKNDKIPELPVCYWYLLGKCVSLNVVKKGIKKFLLFMLRMQIVFRGKLYVVLSERFVRRCRTKLTKF